MQIIAEKAKILLKISSIIKYPQIINKDPPSRQEKEAISAYQQNNISNNIIYPHINNHTNKQSPLNNSQ